MTAVQWLVEQIKNDHNQKALSANQWMDVIEQAKQMEKEQIIDAFTNGEHQQGFEAEAEQYYNETYGQ